MKVTSIRSCFFDRESDISFKDKDVQIGYKIYRVSKVFEGVGYKKKTINEYLNSFWEFRKFLMLINVGIEDITIEDIDIFREILNRKYIKRTAKSKLHKALFIARTINNIYYPDSKQIKQEYKDWKEDNKIKKKEYKELLKEEKELIKELERLKNETE